MKLAPERFDTARLRATRYRAEDEADLVRINGDLEVMRHIEAGGRTPAKVKNTMAQLDAQWATHGFGYWVLREPQTGAFVGGLVLFEHSVTGGVEVGYVLDRPWWGKGLATEALGGLLKVAFEVLGLPAVYARVEPENAQSLKVLLKLGFAFDKVGGDELGVLHHYRLEAPHSTINPGQSATR